MIYEQDNDNEKFKQIVSRLELFKKEKMVVHCLFKNLGRKTFYNGLIQSILPDRFVIVDKKFGASLVFYCDIEKLENYRGFL